MRFLIDADLPRRTVDLLRARGHEATDVRDVVPPILLDPEIAANAQQEGLCLISCDWGFADIRSYPPQDYAGLVVLQQPKNATADDKLTLVELLLNQPQILSRLPGRLAIVSVKRIRLRPA